MIFFSGNVLCRGRKLPVKPSTPPAAARARETRGEREERERRRDGLAILLKVTNEEVMHSLCMPNFFVFLERDALRAIPVKWHSRRRREN
jgi:hypothetical protein